MPEVQSSNNQRKGDVKGKVRAVYVPLEKEDMPSGPQVKLPVPPSKPKDSKSKGLPDKVPYSDGDPNSEKKAEVPPRNIKGEIPMTPSAEGGSGPMMGKGEGQGQGQGQGQEGQKPNQGQGQDQGQKPSQGRGQGQSQGPKQDSGQPFPPGQASQSPNPSQGDSKNNPAGQPQANTGDSPKSRGQGQGDPGKNSPQKRAPSGESGSGNHPATGMHTGTAGGNPSQGSSDHRCVVDEDFAALNMPPEQVQKLRSLGRLIGQARQELREGGVSPELLKQLHMSQPQFAQFVDRYALLFDRIQTAGPAGDSAQRAVVAAPVIGQSQLQRGSGGLGLSGNEKLTPDQLRQLHQSHMEQVSPEYRKLVEDYFRAVNEPQK